MKYRFSIIILLLLNTYVSTNKINLLRHLDYEQDVEEICKKGSDDLNEYYQTGDMSLIDIDENEEVKNDKSTSYGDALVNLIYQEICTSFNYSCLFHCSWSPYYSRMDWMLYIMLFRLLLLLLF